jgi:hypothetical protein
MTRTLRRTGSGKNTLRQVLTALSVAAAFAAVGLGCDAEDALSSADFRFRDRQQCTGAFTPHSEACWEDPGDGGEEEIAANDQQSQQNRSDVAGMDRCAGGIVGAPGTPGTLTVTFTTTVTKGMYSPQNCGAVWVEDSLTFYVRTLELWTAERHASIVQWDTRVCKKDPTVTAPDVITSATLRQHKSHTSKWDLKDFRGNVVPDGQYTLWLQVAENEIFPEGPFLEIPFTKGTTPQTFTLPNDKLEGFKDITITYQPAPP